MLKISVISYKSTILPVHRSVLLKYLRFPDQHIKRKLTRPTTRGTYQNFIRGVTAPGMNPLPIYIPFLTEKVSFRVLSIKKWCPLKSRFSLHPFKLL